MKTDIRTLHFTSDSLVTNIHRLVNHCEVACKAFQNPASFRVEDVSFMLQELARQVSDQMGFTERYVPVVEEEVKA